MSKGENKIVDLLNQAHMTFQREKSFSDLKHGLFRLQLFQLNNYLHLSPSEPENRFSSRLDLKTYSRGMGALGLPGDMSSQSRFVRGSFVKLNAQMPAGEAASVNQFFHILSSVEQSWGCCDLGQGRQERTIYSSCCSADRGIYYYTTYGNHRITAVNMHMEDLNGKKLVCYPLISEEQIFLQNEKPSGQ